MSEWVKGAGNLVSRDLSFSVANWAIPVARGVAIRAGLGGHTAPLNGFDDSDLVSHHLSNLDPSEGSGEIATGGGNELCC